MVLNKKGLALYYALLICSGDGATAAPTACAAPSRSVRAHSSYRTSHARHCRSGTQLVALVRRFSKCTLYSLS